MSFLLPLIGLICGILLGKIIYQQYFAILMILFSVGIFCYLNIKGRNPTFALQSNKYHYVWIVLLFIGIGNLDFGLHSPYIIPAKEMDSISFVRGKVVEAKTLAEGDRFFIEVEELYYTTGKNYTPQNLLLFLTTDGFSAEIGDILAFPVKIKRIDGNIRNRYNGFADRMERKGILYTSFSANDKIYFIERKIDLRSCLCHYRDTIISKIEKSSLNRQSKDFIIALILGDKSFLQSEVKDQFNKSGIAHILALSGTHLALIMIFLLLLLYPLNFLGCRLLRYWLCIFLLWCYTFITGASPSTLRAAIMITFSVIALSFQRKNKPENALFGATFIILVFDPLSLFDIGLQLSFLCVACILFFVNRLNTVDRHSHHQLYTLNNALLTSMVAMAGTWVLISYYFGIVPLLFLPVNLIILPFIPVYMAVACIYIILIMIGFDLKILVWILEKGYQLMSDITWWVTSLEGSVLSFRASAIVVSLWLVGLLILVFLLRYNKKKFYLGLCGCFLLGVIVFSPAIKGSSCKSIMIDNNFSKIVISSFDNNEETIHEIPRKSLSCYSLDDIVIISIDSVFNFHEMEVLKSEKVFCEKKVFLLVCEGSRLDSISRILHPHFYQKIILHPSFRRKKEKSLLQQAREAKLNNIHSLRDEGPYEIFL